jgi:hypothetical protein
MAINDYIKPMFGITVYMYARTTVILAYSVWYQTYTETNIATDLAGYNMQWNNLWVIYMWHQWENSTYRKCATYRNFHFQHYKHSICQLLINRNIDLQEDLHNAMTWAFFFTTFKHRRLPMIYSTDLMQLWSTTSFFNTLKKIISN